MIDAETLEQLNAPPPRAPVMWPAWRTDFEVALHMPLVDYALTLEPWQRMVEAGRTASLLKEINESTPLCHHYVDLQILRYKIAKIPL